MKVIVWAGLGLALGALLACGSESVHAAERVTLTGSSTIAPLVQAGVERYEVLHPGIRIDVQTGGSSRGIADAARGLNEIGMTSRALKPEEAPGLAQHVLAIDGIAFVVHADNPVGELTRDQARSIFTGELSNWSEVGGADRPIIVVSRPEGRSELDLVSEFLGLTPSEIKADVVGGENQQAIKLVAGHPDAIVYLSLGTAAYEAKAGTSLRLLDLDGVPAVAATVADGSYPLARPLVLVTGREVSSPAQAFLDYLLSPSLDLLIGEQGFVAPPR